MITMKNVQLNVEALKNSKHLIQLMGEGTPSQQFKRVIEFYTVLLEETNQAIKYENDAIKRFEKNLPFIHEDKERLEAERNEVRLARATSNQLNVKKALIIHNLDEILKVVIGNTMLDLLITQQGKKYTKRITNQLEKLLNQEDLLISVYKPYIKDIKVCLPNGYDTFVDLPYLIKEDPIVLDEDAKPAELERYHENLNQATREAYNHLRKIEQLQEELDQLKSETPHELHYVQLY